MVRINVATEELLSMIKITFQNWLIKCPNKRKINTKTETGGEIIGNLHIGIIAQMFPISESFKYLIKKKNRNINK